MTKNLGQIAAIIFSDTPPTNTEIIWYDTSVTSQDRALHLKVYNGNTGQWELLIRDDNYRQGSALIDGETVVSFSDVLSSNNYFVEVLEFRSNSGVLVSGGDANSLNNAGNFKFIPPTRYQQGTLIYRATLNK